MIPTLAVDRSSAATARPVLNTATCKGQAENASRPDAPVITAAAATAPRRLLQHLTRASAPARWVRSLGCGHVCMLRAKKRRSSSWNTNSCESASATTCGVDLERVLADSARTSSAIPPRTTHQCGARAFGSSASQHGDSVSPRPLFEDLFCSERGLLAAWRALTSPGALLRPGSRPSMFRKIPFSRRSRVSFFCASRHALGVSPMTR